MRRNLVFIRAGDDSLHGTWVTDRKQRNYDVFISYYGKYPGRYEGEGEYYEASPGLKYPTITRLLKEQADLFYSYDAFWLPDDDVMTSPGMICRMFELFELHDLWLAQPALAPGSYIAHPVTRVLEGQSLHFSHFVEVMCPLFSRATLQKLQSTFSLNSSTWGLDFLWSHLLQYPDDRMAIFDETPVVHTRPVGEGAVYRILRRENVDPHADHQQIVNEYQIPHEELSAKIIRSVPMQTQNGSRCRSPFGEYISLYDLQRVLAASKTPIYYENCAGRLKSGGNPEIRSLGLLDSGIPETVKSGEDEHYRILIQDILNHWNTRRQVIQGKAIILAADRQSCLRLSEAIRQHMPDSGPMGVISVLGVSEDDSGSDKDGSTLARFDDPKDSLEMIIVDQRSIPRRCLPCFRTLYFINAVSTGDPVEMFGRVIQCFPQKLGCLIADYSGSAEGVYGGILQQRLVEINRQQEQEQIHKFAAAGGVAPGDVELLFARFKDYEAGFRGKLAELENSFSGPAQEREAYVQSMLKKEVQKIAAEVLGEKGVALVEHLAKSDPAAKWKED